LLLGVLILVVAAVVARLLWGWLSQRGLRRVADAASEELPSRPAELLEQARAAHARGDLRAALRLRFRAVVAAMDLPSSSLQTNSQLARLLRREVPLAASPFSSLSAAFEDVWYGGVACTEGIYRDAEQLAVQVESALRLAQESRRAEAAA
jgi:hypothetical protein